MSIGLVRQWHGWNYYHYRIAQNSRQLYRHGGTQRTYSSLHQTRTDYVVIRHCWWYLTQWICLTRRCSKWHIVVAIPNLAHFGREICVTLEDCSPSSKQGSWWRKRIVICEDCGVEWGPIFISTLICCTDKIKKWLLYVHTRSLYSSIKTICNSHQSNELFLVFGSICLSAPDIKNAITWSSRSLPDVWMMTLFNTENSWAAAGASPDSLSLRLLAAFGRGIE